MQQIEKLLSIFFRSSLPAVAAMLVWCFISIVFFEKLPANNGLGWDGARYANIAANLFNSSELDSYTIMRILPSFLVHIFFSLLGIDFSPQNIIWAFEILNSFLLCVCVFLTLKIFDHFKLSNPKKALGLVLVFVSYATLNFPFYYTVMTDTAGFTIAIAALFFFLKKETLNLWLLGFIAAFTWPIALLQILALLFFNENNVAFKPMNLKSRILLFATGFVWGCTAAYYFLIVQRETNDMAYTLPIDQNLLWLSIPSVGITAGLLTLLLSNKTFFEWSYLVKFFTVKNIVFPISLVAVVAFLIKSLALKTSGYAGAYFLMKGIIYGAAKPFIIIVSSVNYFGVAVLIAILFGKEIVAASGKLGLGFCLAIVVNMLAVGLRSEVRVMSNIFPWLALLCAIALKDKKLHPSFYFAATFLNLLFSKIWMKINTGESSRINADGTIGFPEQKFFMNLGAWMSSEVYWWLSIAVISSLILLWILKMQKPSNSKVLIEKNSALNSV